MLVILVRKIINVQIWEKHGETLTQSETTICHQGPSGMHHQVWTIRYECLWIVRDCSCQSMKSSNVIPKDQAKASSEWHVCFYEYPTQWLRRLSQILNDTATVLLLPSPLHNPFSAIWESPLLVTRMRLRAAWTSKSCDPKTATDRPTHRLRRRHRMSGHQGREFRKPLRAIGDGLWGSAHGAQIDEVATKLQRHLSCLALLSCFAAYLRTLEAVTWIQLNQNKHWNWQQTHVVKWLDPGKCLAFWEYVVWKGLIRKNSIFTCYGMKPSLKKDELLSSIQVACHLYATTEPSMDSGAYPAKFSATSVDAGKWESRMSSIAGNLSYLFVRWVTVGLRHHMVFSEHICQLPVQLKPLKKSGFRLQTLLQSLLKRRRKDCDTVTVE